MVTLPPNVIPPYTTRVPPIVVPPGGGNGGPQDEQGAGGDFGEDSAPDTGDAPQADDMQGPVDDAGMDEPGMDEPGDGEGEPCEPGDGEEPAMEPDPITGMEIISMEDGTAQAAGMKVGDIIMAVNGMPTPDFDSLRAALEASAPEAEFDFINADSGELERINVGVEDTRIGVDVEQVVVEQATDD